MTSVLLAPTGPYIPGSEPRFSRLRLQRYYKKPIRSKLFPIFFSSFFTKIPKPPLAQRLTPQNFYAVKHVFASSYGLANNKTREFHWRCHLLKAENSSKFSSRIKFGHYLAFFRYLSRFSFSKSVNSPTFTFKSSATIASSAPNSDLLIFESPC